MAEALKALGPLLEEPEVSKALQFLAELDALAEEYEFTLSEILLLIDPSRASQLKEGRLPSAPAVSIDEPAAAVEASQRKLHLQLSEGLAWRPLRGNLIGVRSGISTVTIVLELRGCGLQAPTEYQAAETGTRVAA